MWVNTEFCNVDNENHLRIIGPNDIVSSPARATHIIQIVVTAGKLSILANIVNAYHDSTPSAFKAVGYNVEFLINIKGSRTGQLRNL
jgi:hypothetical protein